MKPGYRLALELGIPIVIQPEWNMCLEPREEGRKLLDKGKKLWDEGWKLQEEGEKLREEGVKIWDEGRKLWDEGERFYTEAVTRELGPEYVERVNWKTGEATKA